MPLTGADHRLPSVSADDKYLLCELGGLPVAVSSSLPTGQTFELVRTIRRADIDEIARATAAGEPVSGADALVLVDPVSTGAVVAYQTVHRMGLQIICVWSESIPDELKGFVAKGMAVPYAGVITHVKGELAKTVAAIRALGIPLAACIVGCETGVTLGDLLSEALRLPTNGTLKTGLRRNKYAQTEAVRSAGLEACYQMQAETIEGVEAFIAAWRPTPYRAVVKPVEGAGSDGVSIVDTPDGVRRAFHALEGTKNVLGLTNYSVLLQEYLKGARRQGTGRRLCVYARVRVGYGRVGPVPAHKEGGPFELLRRVGGVLPSPASLAPSAAGLLRVLERQHLPPPTPTCAARRAPLYSRIFAAGEEYVVDTVTRDGVHKCVAIWKYDKRVYNGAPVVYFGMQLLPIEAEPALAEMVRYTTGVLDALAIVQVSTATRRMEEPCYALRLF